MIESFLAVFSINFDWVEKLWFQKSLDCVPYRGVAILLIIIRNMLLKVLNSSDQKFLGGVVAEHDTFGSCLCQNKESFVHAIEQLDILDIENFHPRMKWRDIQDQHGKQRVNKKHNQNQHYFKEKCGWGQLLHENQAHVHEAKYDLIARN